MFPAPLAGPSLLRESWQNESVDDNGLWPWGFRAVLLEGIRLLGRP